MTSFRTWLRSRPAPRPAPPARNRARLGVDRLEDRSLPSGWAAAAGAGGNTNWGTAFDPGAADRPAAVYAVGTRTDAGGTAGWNLAKYDPATGSLLADVRFGSSRLWHVAVDPAGGVYLSGSFSGTLAVGAATLTSAGGTDVLVAKLDPALNVLWAHGFGGAADDNGYGVAADAAGVSVAVAFAGTAGLDGNAAQPVLTSAGGEDAGVLRLTAAGAFGYAARAGGTGADRGLGVAVDAAGGTYLTGYFAGTATFSSPAGTQATLTSSGANDGFVAKLDPTGNFAWARRVGGAGTDPNVTEWAYGVGADGAGRVFVAGKFAGTGAFGDATDGTGAASLPARGPVDAFVTSLDAASGRFLWTRQLGGAWGSTWGRELAVGGDGSVYVTGKQTGPYTRDFGPGAGAPVLAAAPDEGFLLKVSGAGDLLGAWASAGKGGDVTGVAVGPDGAVYTAGGFGAGGGPSAFDSGAADLTLTGSGAFAAKMTQEGLGAVVGRVMVAPDRVVGVAPHAVTLTDAAGAVHTATTGPGGLYRFAHLPAGGYTLSEPADAGWTQSFPAPGTVPANGLVTGQDFANSSPTAGRTYANGTAVKIKPSGYTTSAITVANTSTVYDINVKVDITFPNVSGLNVRLIAPDGTRVDLVTNGTASGSNLKGTVFDDQAAGPLPPSSTTGYAGTFRPTSPLAAMNGKSLSGTWTLQIFTGLTGGTINSWSMTVTGSALGSPLVAASAPPAGAAPARLTAEELAPLVREAVRQWAAAGLSPAQEAVLARTEVRVADLGPAYLGVTDGTTVWVDDDAAGWGWFADPTPGDDAEFTTPGDQGEQNRMDLLSAMMHEIGHLLGRDHDEGGVMGEALASGERLGLSGVYVDSPAMLFAPPMTGDDDAFDPLAARRKRR